MAKLTEAQKKSLRSYVGLFDVDFASDFLKKSGYNFVSWREKTIPNAGTPSYPLSYFIKNAVKPVLNSKYTKITFSKNGNVTIKSSKGYFQFF
jgi:hypothetical protein